jgi:hypothetical protein
VAPDEQYRGGIEAVELWVNNQDRLTYAFEVTLFDCTRDRPYEERLRGTTHNSQLAAYTTEAVATDADAFANGWADGLPPGWRTSTGRSDRGAEDSQCGRNCSDWFAKIVRYTRFGPHPDIGRFTRFGRLPGFAQSVGDS